jgi:hypothetical protein
MKVQLKLDKDTVQQFFIDHTEKIVFGAVCLGILFLVYRASGQKGYGKKPEDLQQSVTSAKANIDRDKTIELTFPPYEEDVGKFRKAVDEKGYLVASWHAKIIPPKRHRDMPEGQQLAGLRGSAWRGKLSTAGRTPAKGARAEPEGQRWIVLTGRVPLQDQIDAYQKALQGVPLASDAPKYAGFFIQRVEVEPGATANPDWSKAVQFSKIEMQESSKGESGKSGTEVVSEKHRHPVLTSPLPPSADRQWGLEVVCDPEIPMKSAGEATGRAPSGAPGHGDAPAPRSGRGEDPTSPFHAATAEAKSETAPKPADSEKDKLADVLLFRYFDFRVEPGKWYRYRVLLLLQNPNYGLKPAVLSDPRLADSRFIGVDTKDVVKQSAELGGGPWKVMATTGWSAPSDPIYVSDDVKVQVVSATRTRSSDPPMGKIRIVKWIEDQGLDAAKEFDVVRGKVADFKDETVGTKSARQPKTGGRRNTSELASTTVDFITGELVVDIGGGDPPPLAKARSAPPRPAQLLMLDKAGTLVFHDEVEDRIAYENENADPGRVVEKPSGKEATRAGPVEGKKTKPPAKEHSLDGDIFDANAKSPKPRGKGG